MRTLACGGLGVLVAMIALVAWGVAEHGRAGILYLVCFGGFVLPVGFVGGCLVGGIISLAEFYLNHRQQKPAQRKITKMSQVARLAAQ